MAMVPPGLNVKMTSSWAYCWTAAVETAGVMLWEGLGPTGTLMTIGCGGSLGTEDST